MKPSVQLLGTDSSKCFFSYRFNKNSFQIGYLGIGPSRILGGFHLRYPITSPIYTSKIIATLIGKETSRFIFHNDLNDSQSKEDIFFSQTQCIYESSSCFTPITSLDLNFDFKLDDDLPPSYQNDHNIPLSYDIIRYNIIITIFRKSNILKLQGKNKIISTICNIERYSLPSEIKSVNSNGLLMDHADSKILIPTSKLNLIKIDALLPSKFIDMNSLLVIPISMVLSNTSAKIEEIYVSFEEYQSFKEVKKDKEIIYCEYSKLIIDYTLLWDDTELLKVFDDQKYLLELKLEIPAFDCTKNSFHAFEGVRIMKYFNLRHVCKIKIKFENDGQLVLQKDVWLQRSLSKNKILEGIKNGHVYQYFFT